MVFGTWGNLLVIIMAGLMPLTSSTCLTVPKKRSGRWKKSLMLLSAVLH